MLEPTFDGNYELVDNVAGLVDWIGDVVVVFLQAIDIVK